MSADYDLCIIGSGAGAGPVAYRLAHAGYSVVVLEKGPWLKEEDLYKDELACCRRSIYTPKLSDEQHVVEQSDGGSNWQATPTSDSGWDLWNGNMVGGSSNLMSGFFHRLRPDDFRQLSAYGPIARANRVDWPISYGELEPYYTMAEKLVGISGHHTPHPNEPPRSSRDFPYPPVEEHPVSHWIDTACAALGYRSLQVPRAILSQPVGRRNSCEYSGYCGSYGCSSGAKGSARVAFIDAAVATGRCEVRPHSQVHQLLSDTKGRVIGARYSDRSGNQKTITAKLYIVACQAVESSRLLLNSSGPKFPNGLANNSGQVGRNLLFSAGGSGSGDFEFKGMDEKRLAQLRTIGPFINRALDDWYAIDDTLFATGRQKGGMVEFLFAHPNPIRKAESLKWDEQGNLLWGLPLKRKLEAWFRTDRTLQFEVFADWLPTDDCFVTLDSKVKDRWGMPVARVRFGHHPHDLQVGRYLAQKGEDVLKQMGAVRVSSSISAAPSTNLMAGGCRFGDDPASSVLNRNCQAHEVENLYVTDGSFMPTGGSVPYTWTIYANALRVADHLVDRLSDCL
uniref:Putative Gluconate 2-dehydrogenase (Acceptor) n=1 Tax=Magnetococcus massalia (strain MO-1) TaxID=451514 RepID=A0A1S7LF41_MAGMO|nr:putative Gluconate 2-dehydrogenase (acceptor) [Candidatus Magnetococcus massalia]